MSFLAAIGPAIAGVASTVGAAATGIGLTSSTLGLLSSVVSGVGALATGMAQAKAMEIQSTNALIQGNQQAMNYQRQAIQVMNRTMETEAAINARGAAGGIDPFSGSAGALSEYALNKGLDEYNWAQQNVEMARLGGAANAAAYRDAASSYMMQGVFGLSAGLLGGFQKYKSVGEPTPPQSLPGPRIISNLTPSPSLSGYPQYVTGTMY